MPLYWATFSDAPGQKLQSSHSPHTWLSFLMTVWAASVLVLRLRARPSISSANFSWRFCCCCRTRSSSAADCFSSPGVGPATPLTSHISGQVHMRQGGGGEETNTFPGNPEVMAAATAVFGAQSPLICSGFWVKRSQKWCLMGDLDTRGGSSAVQGICPALLPPSLAQGLKILTSSSSRPALALEEEQTKQKGGEDSFSVFKLVDH